MKICLVFIPDYKNKSINILMNLRIYLHVKKLVASGFLPDLKSSAFSS